MISVLLTITSDNEGRIEKVIDSIQKQTVSDFELITSKDKRGDLLQHANGDFIISLTENCLLNHYYFEYLLNGFTNTNIGCVYTNGKFLNTKGNITSTFIKDDSYIFKPKSSCSKSYCRSVHNRNVLPFSFGMFRSDIYKKLTDHFNINKEFPDYLLPAKFFLLKGKANFVKYPLLFYYQDHRWCYKKSNNVTFSWIDYLRKQLKFYECVQEKYSKFSYTTLDSCLKECGNLLLLLAKRFSKDEFECNFLEEIYEQYKPIIDLKFSNIYKSDSDINNIPVRLKILNKRVLPFIEQALQYPDEIKKIKKEVDKIKNDFISKK